MSTKIDYTLKLVFVTFSLCFTPFFVLPFFKGIIAFVSDLKNILEGMSSCFLNFMNGNSSMHSEQKSIIIGSLVHGET